MHLTVTTNMQLDSAHWQTALNLFAVLPIDPRCFLCHAGKQFHDTPDEFLHQPMNWDGQTQTHRLEPWYEFTIRFAIKGSLRGRIALTNTYDLAIVREGLQFALQTPYTRANRRRWECDDLRRRAELRLDHATAEVYLTQQQDQGDMAFTYYDRVYQRQLERRHNPRLLPLGSQKEWEEIFTQLATLGAEKRTEQTVPAPL